MLEYSEALENLRKSYKEDVKAGRFDRPESDHLVYNQYGRTCNWGGVEPERKYSCRDIVRAVARFFKIHPDDIYSNKRSTEFTLPRHLAAYIAVFHSTAKSESDIARHLQRDPTSIRYAKKKINHLMRHSREVQHLHAECVAALRVYHA